MFEEAVARELTVAQEQLRVVEWIRVTTDALPGSIVAAPITPERARHIRLEQYQTGVEVAAELVARPHLEILVHPDDWRKALITMPGWAFQFEDRGRLGKITRVMGLRVREET